MIKLNLEQQLFLVDKLRKYLTKELGREPTEKELVGQLPIFLCKVP
jgi:hypothetical protein